MKQLLSNRRTPPITPETSPQRTPNVDFVPPGVPDGTWVITVDGVPVARASAHITELVRSLDGTRAVSQIYLAYSDRLSLEDFLALLGRFQRIGVIAGGTYRAAGRLTYRPPLTVQLASLKSAWLFSRTAPLLRPVFSRVGAIVVAAIALTGFVVAAVQLPQIIQTLSQPVTLAGMLAVTAILITATAIHEYAHGAALASFGGTPRRAGFMLFYLAPAFFVDVTDGWRLPSRWQRVGVALSGPAAHLLIGGTAATVGLLSLNQDFKEVCWIVTVACYSVVAFNLIPFVRFDGYLALMTALDEPNLRAKSMKDAGGWIARQLFGAAPEPQQIEKWWSVPFGIASAVFPFVLVAGSLSRLIVLISGKGLISGLVVLGVEMLLALLAVKWVISAVTHLRAKGTRATVVALRGTLLVAAIILIGMVIKVPTQARAGFVQDGGTLSLVQAAGAHQISMPLGQRVELRTNGLLFSTAIGIASVSQSESSPGDADITSLYPIEVPGATVAVSKTSLRVDPGASLEGLPRAGMAQIRLSDKDLWSATFDTFISPALKDIIP